MRKMINQKVQIEFARRKYEIEIRFEHLFPLRFDFERFFCRSFNDSIIVKKTEKKKNFEHETMLEHNNRKSSSA